MRSGIDVMVDARNHRLLRLNVAIRREELPFALLMCAYFFLVITAFWILKPLKKPIFVNYYDRVGFDFYGAELSGAQVELLAKVGNMMVAAGAVVMFSLLARRLRRHQLTFVFAVGFVAAFGAFAFLLESPGALSVWGFYLTGDLWATLMVATFFAFLNDSVDADTARRIYGLIVLGGVAGGVFGSTNLRALIDLVSRAGWMAVCIGITFFIAFTAWRASRRVPEAGDREADVGEVETELDAPRSSVALEGAWLVGRSRYLLAIMTIVGLYEVVSTVVDYQFTATVQHYLDDTAKHYATVYAITNWASILVQLLATTAIMTHCRMGVALLIMPVVLFAGSFAFALLPLLWLGSLLSISDNALNYSINQSAREALYTPTTREVVYKAKAFIDMFVVRLAKTIAVGLSLGFTLIFTGYDNVRWLSPLAMTFLLLWALAATYAGRQFHELVGEAPGDRARERGRERDVEE